MVPGLFLAAPMRRLAFASVLLAACGTPDAAPAPAAPAELLPGPTVPGPSPERPDVGLEDALSPEARAELARAPFPMLLLPREYAAATRITTGERWAALAWRDDALTISLHATDHARPVVSDDEVVTAPPPDDSVRGEPARVMLNEQIRSVAWIEDGVAYALEVECARPMDDARCTEPDFALALAERLVAAGAR